VVKGAESPGLPHYPRGTSQPRQRIEVVVYKSRLIADDFSLRIAKKSLYMKNEHTEDIPTAGRATQISAIVITSLLALIWVYFGVLYLTRDPAECRIVSQDLGYPLYIIPLIGVTHILGGVGLLIPGAPRLTEWVYAGLTIDLLLAAYSHLSSSGSPWHALDPIVVMAFLFASYVLRRCMRGNRWSLCRTHPQVARA
jgi:uncharacterized membrane protein YphA (DoxX/SURF4 family)